MTREYRIGTAGWAIPRAVAERFGDGGSALERYAGRFPCAEITSTFYRTHRPHTFERWAAAVPNAFRFALKLPRAVTHERRLRDADDLLDAFLRDTAGLGAKREVLLVQLPPSAAYEPDVAAAFFAALRERYDGRAACEPRHSTWFAADPNALLRAHRIARVAADPAVVPEAAEPGGWEEFTYRRLHGSPAMYRSPYDPAALDALAKGLKCSPSPAWCIFDNTTTGAASANALDLLERLTPRANEHSADPKP